MASVKPNLPRRHAYILDAATDFCSAQVFSATADSASTVDCSPAKLGEAYVIIQSSAYTGFAAGSAQWLCEVKAGSTVVADVVLNGTAKEYYLPLTGPQVASIAGESAGALKLTLTKTGSPGNVTLTAFLSGVDIA